MRLPFFIQRRLNKGKPPLKLYWWRYRYPDKLNFGDEITAPIIEGLWGRKSEWADKEDCKIIGTGSILHLFKDTARETPIKVWGSGLISEAEANLNKKFDFFAVRGPMTASRIKHTRPLVMGDPGLLVNKVFEASQIKKYRVGIVAHYIDRDSSLLEPYKSNPDYLLIDTLQSPVKVALDITSCSYVLSSSLHGLIFADSFGIPNNWMPLSNNVAGGAYKFEDYYASTNRMLVSKKAQEILGNDDAIERAIMEYQKIRHLKKMQRRLINCFPYQINFEIKAAIFFVLSPSKLKKLYR